MAFEGGNLNMALAAAVGDDASLVRDLRRAFLESADRQIDLLSRAGDESAWHLALWRLKGLSGSFGVVHMIALIDEAQGSAPGDAKIVRRLRSALDMLSAD
ncbi:Hpt domain-containing protein [Sphingobium fluviale]|uniref:Hpt domain-containing protein n=2 Tax=Sphingobium fluviale TaxID=2506423 RepID=A0A4Q1KLH1_9SPHN|nr:Hpt domain-containing protein [Sphingobium fluviale]RXR29989.1 Hpt domain-containing protein [Sphingobium fluviale]